MRRLWSLPILAALAVSGRGQATFDVASIRPSSGTVAFEQNGQTSFSHGTLHMRDVPLRACIAFAYEVATAQILGPAPLDDARYDITAKTDPQATEPQVRTMLQSLLSGRFHLAIHHGEKDMRGYILQRFPAPGGAAGLHPSAAAGEPYRQNSATGTVARHITMKQLADFLSGPLHAPVADETGLSGEYDLELDFTPYVNLTAKPEDQPSTAWVLNAALKAELGLQITARKGPFDVIVVDHVEAPSPN